MSKYLKLEIIQAIQVKSTCYSYRSLTWFRRKTLNWWQRACSEGEIFLLACSSFPSPDAHKKTDGSNFTRVERTSWNVLCVRWEVGGRGVETPRSSLWKCRPLPQVLERSREPGLKINWPPSTWASGMSVRTCLLAQDADTHLSRNGNKKEKKRKHQRQIGATWQNQGPHRSAG